MHAQYSKLENSFDQYYIHRLCQSYQLAKFINLMTGFPCKNPENHNLIVLAGDLNTSSNELSYQLLGNAFLYYYSESWFLFPLLFILTFLKTHANRS